MMLKVLDTTIDEILAQLRAKGHRITKARVAIIQTLMSASKPLTAANILMDSRVKAVSKEKTTVYRELEFLLGEKLARSVELQDGKRRFEITHSGDHHHHLVCTSCETVTCVSLPHHLHEIERDLEKKHKFLIETHTLEFFGLCSACR